MRLTIATVAISIAAMTLGAAQGRPKRSAPAASKRLPAPKAQATQRRAHTPFDGNKAAIADGEKLFVAYNCVDCHGGGGSGFMAPSLADNRWRYGGSPSEVFASITQGRPEGMPTWGPLIPTDQVWKLVAYVETLGAGKDVSTEDFRPKVVRMGH